MKFLEICLLTFLTLLSSSLFFSFDSSSGIENATLSVFPPTPDFAVLSYDEIPARWSRLMSAFVLKPSIDQAIDSLPCFPLVLKSWSIWLLRLTRETTQILAGLSMPDISSRFLNVEETLENELRLPYIFIDEDVFRAGQLLLKHRLTVLKLNVGLQGLHEKKEQAQENIYLIQSTKHEFSSDDELSELFDNVDKSKQHDERNVLELCTCLYRLHMQFVMCLEIYLTYVEKIVAIVHTSQEVSYLLCMTRLETTVGEGDIRGI